MTEEVSIAHFSSNGHQAGSALPGVERVIATQRELLQAEGIHTTLIVGATDHSDPESHDIVVVPDIRSAAHPTWAAGQTDVDPATVARIVDQVEDISGGGAVIAHNTTNAAGHNPPFGVAMAEMADQRERDGGEPVVLWVHDARRASTEQLQRLLPTVDGTRIALISETRRAQFVDQLEKMRDQGAHVPDYHIEVIGNPIDDQFLAAVHPAPHTITELAPAFHEFTAHYQLPQTEQMAEQILFGDHDALRIVVPARIVGQKGIEHAIAVCQEYQKRYGRHVALIVTGTPDERKPENVLYWQRIQELIHQTDPQTCSLLFLGGVEWSYMPWLFQHSDLLLALFTNEGFSLTPLEAALCGCPAAISTDPAMMETTDYNALVLPSIVLHADIAQRIHNYLSSGKPALDTQALRERTMQMYAAPAIARRTVALLGN